MSKFNQKLNELVAEIKNANLDNQVQMINDIKLRLKEVSPFGKEPVDMADALIRELEK